MDCLDAIMTRRSIRRYTGQPVTEADLDVIVRAAMAAPSAGNQQSWRIVVARDPEVRMRLSTSTPHAGMLAEASVGLVVCGDTRDERHPGYWVQDCSAAIENALLAIRALGLGAVWIGVYPIDARVRNVSDVLGLPDGVVPLGMISIGHPAEDKPPAERFNESFVHHDRW